MNTNPFPCDPRTIRIVLGCILIIFGGVALDCGAIGTGATLVVIGIFVAGCSYLTA